METPAVAEVSLSRARSGLTGGGAWLMAAAASLIVYGATVCPDVLMMDYGEYQRATWLFPHIEPPQGSLVRVHINYLIAAKLFGLLVPAGQWALRVNLFSAVAGSIAVGNACALTLALTRSKPATVLTWLVLTLGQITWLYSVITHVASLQAATISAEILMLYLWATSGNLRWLVALWAINGFAAGVHMQNGLATPIYLAVLLLAWRQGQVSLKHVALCLGVWLVGFSPYVIFCFQHWMANKVDGSAIASMTVGKWGGQMWRINLLSQSDRHVCLKGLLGIVLNYPTGLALLSIPGIVALRKTGLPVAFRWSWLAVIAVSLLFAVTYNVPDQQRYFTAPFAAAAPLLGLGAALVLRSRTSWAAVFALAGLVVPLYAVLPAVVRQPAVARRLPLPKANALPYRDPHEFYLKPWKTGWHNDRRYLEEALQDLPQDAMFICSSTVYDGLKTVQVIESRRADLALNPSPAALAANLGEAGGTASRWRRPVYSWSASETGVPKPLVRFCRFVAKGIIWEVLPPENPKEFLDQR